MTVAELIAELQRLPPSADVRVDVGPGRPMPSIAHVDPGRVAVGSVGRTRLVPRDVVSRPERRDLVGLEDQDDVELVSGWVEDWARAVEADTPHVVILEPDW